MKRRKKLLVVEDDYSMRTILKEALVEAGYDVSDAKDGKDALEMLGESEYDLVITDLMMPRVDGMKLLEIVKTKYPGVGVFIITAYGTVERAVEALQKGAYDFIAKRGRYLYAYNWNGLDIIECLFDTSNVWEGGYNDGGSGDDIDIYPNPVYYGGNVNISSRHDITIYDIRGNVAAKISGGNKTVKLNLTPGIYFAVSSNGGKKTVTKFVVIR